MDLDCVLAPIEQFLIAISNERLGVCEGGLLTREALLEASKLLAGSTLGACVFGTKIELKSDFYLL